MKNYIELIVTLGFLGGLMWGMLKFMLRDIHRDLQELKTDVHSIKTDIQKADSRIDHLYEENNRVYKILLDIVKNRNT